MYMWSAGRMHSVGTILAQLLRELRGEKKLQKVNKPIIFSFKALDETAADSLILTEVTVNV